MPHVVVVGGGMAGAAAALAARRQGAEVTLVRRAPGATAVSSGALDAVPPAAADDAAGWLARLPRSDPGHPYVASGAAPTAAALEDGLAVVTDALDGAGLPLRVGLVDPVVVAAVTGEARCAGIVARTVAAGDLRGEGPVVVAGITGLVAVDATAVAAALAARLPGRRFTAATVALPGLEDAVDVDAGECARLLDRPEAATETGHRLRRAVEECGASLVLLPAVLGLDDAEGAALRLYAAAGVPVAEMLTPPPSPPGLRLDRALQRALASAGVRVVTGAVRAVRRDGHRAVAVDLAAAVGLPVEPDPALPESTEAVACDALVLAGGRFIGGGLTRTARPREPLFGLAVWAGGLPVTAQSGSDLVDRPRFRRQPILAAGLRTDAQGRPLDLHGRVAFANVTAAGALLAGLDTTLESGGLGVVAWTGLRAGRTAAALAGAPAAAVATP